MSVEVVSVSTHQQFKDFLAVPFILHQHKPEWVPPLRMVTRQILSKKNPFFQHAEICLWVAYRNRQPVGRIAGIINHNHNQFHQENIAFWGFFESAHDAHIADALFKQVEQWAVAHQANKIRGPMNPSINNECGLQISAFDTQPYLMMPQNPAYYPELVERQHYTKAKDLQAWMVNADQAKIDPRKYQLIKKAKNQYNVTIRTLDMQNYQHELRTIVNIYNDAWQNNWGFVPLTFDEFNYLAADLKSIIIKNFVYFAEVNGEPAGFAIGLPNLNQIFVHIRNGKLLPFNFLKILWYGKIRKVVNQGRIPLLGVTQKYQHLPIGGMLYCEYFDHAVKAGYVSGEFSWILEDNLAMQSGLKFINAQHYKTYRIYDKNL